MFHYFVDFWMHAVAISFLDLNAWVEKTIETYKLAVTARDYSDLDGPKPPLFRCRTYLFGSVFFAVGSFAFLLFTLNLNALNIERGPSKTDGVTETAMYFVENVAAAFPLPSLHNLVFSRQFEVLALTVIWSLISAVAVCGLSSFKSRPGIGRHRQFAFASLTVSVGLIHLGGACALLAVLIMLGRMGGHELPANAMVMTAVVALALALVPLATHFAHKWSRNSRMSGLGAVRSPALYSAIAPLVVMFMLMLTAGLVDGRFNPGLTLLLSGHCGQPDKGACVATFKPKDIDGTVALQSVQAQLVLGYADEVNIVGPRRLAASVVAFDVIQNPDTPLPIQVTTDVTEGVAQKVERGGLVRSDRISEFLSGIAEAIKLPILSLAAWRSMLHPVSDRPDWNEAGSGYTSSGNCRLSGGRG